MATHALKIWPKFFAEIEIGIKTFEFRKNDRGYAVGDRLILREWLPASKQFTGREMVVTVTHMMKTTPTFEKEHAILSIRKEGA